MAKATGPSAPASKLPILTLRKGRDRAVRNRHPWIFSGAVAVAPDAPEGTVVAVHTVTDERLGYGHWIPGRDICCRMLLFTNEAVQLDEAFFRHRFAAALDHRRRFLHPSPQSAYRLINAEGDHLPGLIVDVYADVAVLQARTAGIRAQLDTLVQFLQSEVGCRHVLDQQEGAGEGHTNHWLVGGVEQAAFDEDGLSYVADVSAGQKTGFFLDQRDNRRRVGALAEGRAVLNCFSYSGGFSAQALRGGATHAVSVDSSAGAIVLADAVMQRNGLADRHSSVQADCFEYLAQSAAGQFDLIVLDPPAFAKHVRSVDRAARGYKDINLRAFRAIRPGGILATFSCSQPVSAVLFRQIVFAAAADAGRSVRVLAETHHGPDHPIDLYHPEGEYLKGLYLVVS